MAASYFDIDRAGEIIDHIRKNRDKDISLVDIMALTELLAGSVQPVLEHLDETIYCELRAITDHIAKTKAEIGGLHANDLSQQRIPEADMELNAVVDATEGATNTIMEAAETIMEADPDDMAAYQDTVNTQVMRIFEACSFQDITGQRISKVVETLQFIDHRLSRFTAALGVKDGSLKLTEEEMAREKRKNDQILNGPQLVGQGVEQTDIDAMFAVDAGSSQDDIDALFV
jgi:chemotaxis protein CheZ